MTDLHTHILCGMDDGARDAEMSLRMLKAEQAQGVDTVVLTPHFYRYRVQRRFWSIIFWRRSTAESLICVLMIPILPRRISNS